MIRPYLPFSRVTDGDDGKGYDLFWKIQQFLRHLK